MKDEEYWREIESAVGEGTFSILLGTSTRSLRKSLAKIRAEGDETVKQRELTEAQLLKKCFPDRWFFWVETLYLIMFTLIAMNRAGWI